MNCKNCGYKYCPFHGVDREIHAYLCEDYEETEEAADAMGVEQEGGKLMKKGVTIMEIIKIRAKDAKEIGDALVAELSKGIPEEKREVFREMVETWGKIDDRADEAKAIPLKLVEKFNSLCYKLFPEEQDGAEFEKEEVQKEKAAQTQGNKIPYTERKRVYEEAIDRWGIPAQIQMVIEEMSELTKELCKNFRGANNLDNIADECADVTIMLEQLRLIFNLNEEVCRHMDQKVARLKERLQAKPKATPRELTEKEIKSKEAWESMRARLEERLKGRTEP